MNLLRAFRAISGPGLRIGKRFPGVPCVLAQSRCVSSAQYAEPQFGVVDEDDDYMDPTEVKVPMMPDKTRQEMFTKYMQDPKEWSFENLSKRYGSSLIRTKAIILLMQRRHNMIANDEATLRRLSGEKNVVVSDDASNLRIRPGCLVVPRVFDALRWKHEADNDIPLDELIASYNNELEQSGRGGEKATFGEEELEEAFTIMAKHIIAETTYKTSQKVEEYEKKGLLEEYISTKFQETPSQFHTSKASNYLNRPNKHIHGSFQDNYFPNITGDEDVRREEMRLLKRIEFETKAQLEHDVEYYERRYNLKEPADAIQDARTAPLPSALQYYRPPPAGMPLSRWKIAFQDLSQSAVPKTKQGLRVPDRTVMRTRAGELRYATPAEESNVSWRVRPVGLDRGLAMEVKRHRERLIDPYVDVDRDEQALRDQQAARKAKRRAVFAAAGVNRK